MNYQIDSQVKNMVLMVQTFKQGCAMAARKDDGKIDSDEKRQLKIIEKAVDTFVKELQKASR